MKVEMLVPSAAAQTVSIEETSCLLCGGSEHVSILCAADALFHVVKCRRCGLHFTNPRPTLDSIGHFYPPQYRPHAGKAHHHRSLRSWYPLDWLQIAKSGISRPRLLDFGCGAGHFLAAMDRAGWEVTGLDMSQATVNAIREQIGLAAYAGSLPHKVFEPQSFDCITMWHALEHVHDPLNILREARCLLVPGGHLIVAVPNFASWSRNRFGDAWFGLDLPRHLTHFDSSSLIQMLESAELQMREVRYSRHADWICASAQRGRNGLANRLLRNRRIAAITARLWVREDEDDVVMIRAQRM